MLLTLLPYSFGPENDKKIRELDYDFALRLQVLLHCARVYLGLKPLIVSGRRTAAEQDALHRKDSRNPPAAKGSSHMAGKAVDINFSRNGVLVLLKGTNPASWKPIYDIAAELGISNGSKFSGYPDNDHLFKS